MILADKSKYHHIPVLVQPFLELGFSEHGKVFVDATFGFGGHTNALLQKYPQIETCIGIDRDAEVLSIAKKAGIDSRIELIQGRASRLSEYLLQRNLRGVDGILMDLGVSSYQLDNEARGFSFTRPGPLDMRMDQKSGISAESLVNKLSQEDLSRIFHEFGEERFSRMIAKAIVARRALIPFTATDDLAQVIERAVPGKMRRGYLIHPATRVFQALRIVVNDELEELRTALESMIPCLNHNGRISIISFHSLEDKIVKDFFRRQKRGCVCPPTFPVCNCGIQPSLEIITSKAIFADEREIHDNPRARSARLRVARKIN